MPARRSLISFSRAMIFLTSNLGSREMMRLLNPTIGFSVADPKDTEKRLAAAGLAAACKRFTPEFMNRLDYVASFHPLTKSDLYKILKIEIQHVADRVENARPDLDFVLDKGVTAFLVDDGYEQKYGARHLKRSITKHIVEPLANILSSDQIPLGSTVTIHKHRNNSGLYFTSEPTAEGAAA